MNGAAEYVLLTGESSFIFTARSSGDAKGMQVPRHVGLMHRQDVLDALA